MNVNILTISKLTLSLKLSPINIVEIEIPKLCLKLVGIYHTLSMQLKKYYILFKRKKYLVIKKNIYPAFTLSDNLNILYFPY